jgi:hypothetical protein
VAPAATLFLFFGPFHNLRHLFLLMPVQAAPFFSFMAVDLGLPLLFNA